MAKIDLKYAIWKEGKHYVSQCLNVEVSSFGNSKKEALALYFEDIKSPKVLKITHVQIVSGTLKHA